VPVTYLDIDDPQDVGQRLDNFMMRSLKGVPRPLIYRVVRKGEVRVNGGRVKVSYRLQLHDRVRIPPMRTAAEMPVQYSPATAELLLAAVVFDDDDFLVLNKPPGIAVHGGSSISSGVVEILRAATGNDRLELVHRLDRGTSGCLILAKRRPALVEAQNAFRARTVKKIYEAFVEGQWPAGVRTVQLRLKRYETSWGERRVRVDSSGLSARTDFSILDTASTATRLQAVLHTGRTHQIRVHTSATGHPICGDDKYAVPGAKPAPRFARLCLHARKLQLPIGGDMLRIEAPIDEEMERIWVELADGR